MLTRSAIPRKKHHLHRAMLTLPNPITTPVRTELAHVLQRLTPSFARVLSAHYEIDSELTEAIDILDAFVSETIATHDALCHGIQRGRLEKLHAAVRELDGVLAARLGFRGWFLYFHHLIARYSQGSFPTDSPEARWRAVFLRGFRDNIEGLRREFEERDDLHEPYPFRL